MREATARYEPDFTLADDREAEKPRRRRKTVSPSAARSAENRARLIAAIHYVLDNPVRVMATAALAIAVVSFTLNALFFQQGRHPAPLFAPKAEPSAAIAAPAPSTVQSPQLVALPPERPADLTARKDTNAAAAPTPSRDAIGDLLRGGAVPTAAQDAKQEQVRLIAAAQRALNRLGYGPIKADGVYGSGTKLAIERFERERKLPVTGEINPRMLKELSAASGIAFD